MSPLYCSFTKQTLTPCICNRRISQLRSHHDTTPTLPCSFIPSCDSESQNSCSEVMVQSQSVKTLSRPYNYCFAILLRLYYDRTAVILRLHRDFTAIYGLTTAVNASLCAFWSILVFCSMLLLKCKDGYLNDLQL